MNDLRDELGRLRAAADFDELPRAWGEPLGSVVLRQEPADFQVSEHTGIALRGDGEHVYVRLRKIGQNTRWVAKRLGEFAGIPYKLVSYAGLKDRHAVTEQWFSLQLAGRPDPDWSALDIEGVDYLESGRHDRKLRQGQLSYNRFSIVLRDCGGVDATELDTRMELLSAHGVPNYFGPQRFGRDQGNLALALEQPRLKRLPREKRAFALSALRGALFNEWLASRVADNTWRTPLDGEALLSDRPRGAAEDDSSLFSPVRMPAGMLWGKGYGGTGGAVRKHELEFVNGYPAVAAALEAAGARFSRRVLCARVGDLSWSWQGPALTMEFALGPGMFATMVLRELFAVRDAALEKQESA